MAHFRELTVWQKSMDLVIAVYTLSDTFPKTEQFGLSSQMRRASVSIPSNIAEGSRRGGKDVTQFLRIAFGSASELETQLEIAKRLRYGTAHQYLSCEILLPEVAKMLNKMIQLRL